MKIEWLKDGVEITLREPTLEDTERSCRFFGSLPAEDQRYFRYNLGNKEVVESLIRQAETGMAYRVIALAGEEIVGHGALYFSVDNWQRHIGELRVLVANEFRNRRLGTFLIGHLVKKAEDRGIERVVARMAQPEIGARKICDKVGFVVDAVLPDHVKDKDGKLHALVVMSCPLDEMTKTLRSFYQEDNWPDG